VPCLPLPDCEKHPLQQPFFQKTPHRPFNEAPRHEDWTESPLNLGGALVRCGTYDHWKSCELQGDRGLAPFSHSHLYTPPTACTRLPAKLPLINLQILGSGEIVPALNAALYQFGAFRLTAPEITTPSQRCYRKCKLGSCSDDRRLANFSYHRQQASLEMCHFIWYTEGGGSPGMAARLPITLFK
jgi:hypothetical protein